MNDITKILLYAAGVYVTVITAGVYLSHAEEVPGLPSGPNAKYEPSTPQQYVVPRISSSTAPLRKRISKSCHEYLNICERSCKERGSLFKFQCIGKDFQPFQDHSRCICADDLQYQRRGSRSEQVSSVQLHEGQGNE
ncbi:hypothetical protein JWJ90_13415 [Desulfobulbus rhabdoformis]|uniref:hypothetical protein n=1 Tax=Desulfobulbus rhabdoformis TaxID=34032 RepID=UPI0019659360|nr:hypothetical protein [Desulfobulbus rhabdoformis]MBM9615277.1 hypothetical protein [Desulfobulbus rhabdoformis]